MSSATERASRVAAAALGVLFTLLSLAAAEALVRWIRPQPTALGYLSDEGLEIHAPNGSGVYRRSEFTVPVKFNSGGFRDDEFLPRAEAGALRVVALGDSFTEGLQVPDAALFTNRIEQLASASGTSVDVANLGVSGYGTDDALRLFETYGKPLSPDLVLLFFCLHNDARNNLREGVCTLAEGELTCAPPPVPSARARLARDVRRLFGENLHLYQLVRGAWATLTEPRPQARQPGEAGFLMGFGGQLFRVPEPEPVAAALEITEALLAELQASAQRAGAETWLVLIPMRRQIEDSRWAEFVASNPDVALERAQPQRAMREIAERLSMPTIDLYEDFRATDARGRRLYWKIDAHFNELGHEVAAEVVTSRLLAERTRLRAPREAAR